MTVTVTVTVTDKFTLIAITPENFVENEVKYITTILDGGIDYVHVRKPNSSISEIESFISKIPKQYYPQLKVSNHQSIALQMGLAGFHINSTSSYSHENDNCLHVSKSCHSIEELKLHSEHFDYLFLSPIYDSISKEGYLASFDMQLLKKELSCYSNIIALGGIDSSKLVELKNIGFAGAAFLGYLFKAPSITELSTRIKLILENV